MVLTTDRLDRVADAMENARRARRIAVQSAVAGMGLSLAAMALAAVGLLPPTLGALLQEAIDLAVILNALRALRGGQGGGPAVQPGTQALVRRFAGEHDDVRAVLPLLRSAADTLAAGAPSAAVEALHRARAALVERVLPHERAEQAELVPDLAAVQGGSGAVAALARSHEEIARLTERLQAHLSALDRDGEPDAERRGDLLACLSALHTLLHLHLAEEEAYFALAAE